MGLASKLVGHKSSDQSAATQQQGSTPAGSKYPSAPHQQGNSFPGSGVGQSYDGNQPSSGPPAPAGGYPRIQSGLNASFKPQPLKPERFPSIVGAGAGNQPSGQPGLYQPQHSTSHSQYGTSQPQYGDAGRASSFQASSQQLPTQQYGQQAYGQSMQQQQTQPPSHPGYGQPQYGQLPQQQSGHGRQLKNPQQGGADASGLAIAKVRSIIQINKLQAFYPPQNLQQLETRLSGVNFSALARKWNMSLELAVDLATLSLYDIVIYADDSTSMKYAEGGERINDLNLILERVADVATLFDDDGISIRAINSNTIGDNVTSAAAASAYVAGLRFSGMTPLGTRMEERILKPMVFDPIKRNALSKPVLIVTITDGEPTDEPERMIFSVIKNAKKVTGNSKYGPKAVAFSFAQVGRDMQAQEFLGKLDTDKHVGEMVDCTSYFELEAEEYKRKGVVLTPEIWLVKMLVGAVDPSYDEQDE